MRTTIRLTADGTAFRGRLTPSQADAMVEALQLLRSRDFSDTAIVMQLNADRAEIGRLIERLAGDHETSRDYTLNLHDLHVIHAALTAVATTFISDRGFSEEGFHVRTSFFRENFDALALSLVQAVSDATPTQ
ncbi:hypothetical protein [Streptomyces sp. H27-S2]|uniref:hypothetical protein n=1 Tax=Streptomyces antarcticus TaxID=2996458 RepID=UPI00227174C3|nr:hypothetical protein [Streptomyces sp. H27-S2]MCY0951501.1 hypothetical protein [Streptomyces sp. H27-S2]